MAVNKLADLGPLHRLLLTACPPHPVTGEQSIAILADAVGVVRQVLFNKCRVNKIDPDLAQRIVLASGGRVMLDQFDVFVYTMPVPEEASIAR